MGNERGITLIEVLAGSAILAIIVIVFMQLSGYNMLASHKSDRTTEALRAAEHVLNTIRQETIAGSTPTFPLTTGSYVCTDTTPVCSAFLPPHSQMKVEQQAFSGASSVVMSPDPSSRQVHMQAIILPSNAPQLVTVTITWEERQ